MVKKKILLVDDSNAIRMFERMILGETEFELIEARDGEEALFAAARDRPDLILLDVNMPKIDGFETLRRLRRVDYLKTVPVIVITGVDENEAKAVVDAYTDYVTKPLYAGTLNQKVQKFLELPPTSRRS
jgi:two-component system, cell cycle response regulator DivK